MAAQDAASHGGRVKVFRIGEFARFTRVSVKMLRHYDETGLLPPARVDPGTGYRFYTAGQLPRLNRILLLRDLGFGLAEIAAMLADASGGEDALDAAYARRERELADDLACVDERLRAVRARRAMLRDAGAGPLTDVVVRPVAAQLVATLRCGPALDVGAAFVRLEEYVRDRRARAAAPPLTLLDDGTVTVAVPLSWPVPPAGPVAVTRLAAAPRMACAVHSGPYDGLALRLQQMLRWLDGTGRRPEGPIREVYLRFGAEPELALPPAYLTDRRADLVTELQVPVAARP